MYIWEYNMCFLFIMIIFYADALSYKVTLIILVILLFLKQTFLCAFFFVKRSDLVSFSPVL